MSHLRKQKIRERKSHRRQYRAKAVNLNLDEHNIYKGMILENRLRDMSVGLGATTMKYWIPIWKHNWTANQNIIKVSKRFDKDFNNVPQYKGMPAVCVGAGPSLKANVHLLKKLKGRAIIICSDRAFREVSKHVQPDFVTALDGWDELYKLLEGYEWIRRDHWSTDKVHIDQKGTTLIASVLVHNNTLKAWHSDILFINPNFVSSRDKKQDESIIRFAYEMMELQTSLSMDEVLNLEKKHIKTNIKGKYPLVGTGGNSGTFAVIMAGYMKCNPIALMGMDCSEDESSIPIPYQYVEIRDGEKIWCKVTNEQGNTIRGPSPDLNMRRVTYLVMDDIWDKHLNPHPPQCPRRRFVPPQFLDAAKILGKLAEKETSRTYVNCTEGGICYHSHLYGLSLQDFIDTHINNGEGIIQGKVG